jgi:hypothetical protein
MSARVTNIHNMPRAAIDSGVAVQETWTPSRRMRSAAMAERERIEREVARLATRERTLAAELGAVRSARAGLESELRLVARFAFDPQEDHDPSARRLRVVSPDNPLAEHAPVTLRGAEIREAAVRALAATPHAGAPIHYRTWFDLLTSQGLVPGGKDPVATFLTQVRRSPVVRSTTSSGMYELDLEFPLRAHDKLEELRRELDAIEELTPEAGVDALELQRERRSRLKVEITTTERELDEAMRSLGTERAPR